MNNFYPTLYVMVGCPGSGKSYFTEFFPNFRGTNTEVVSRDKIRFSMLSLGDNYFKNEKKVFNRFVSDINKKLGNGLDVVADATHISKASRSKLLSNICNKEKLNIVAIVINTPLEECIKRNKNRVGLQLVPENVIVKMHSKMEAPTIDEGFEDVWVINYTNSYQKHNY